MPQIRTRLALPAILVMVALAALAIACADEKTATTSPSTPTASATASATASETATPSETATASETAAPSETTSPGATEIVVELKDNVFEPAEITVPANTPITFTAKNTGTAIHNMHILSAATEGQDFSSDTIVAAGTESTFTATFTQAGTVQFQCDFHLPDMVGTITVQ